MAKYKVGDKVRVRPDLCEDTKYAMENSIITNVTVSEMLELKDTIVTIKEVTGSYGYYIEEGPFTWTDEMFIPIPTYELPKDCVGLTEGYYRPFEIKRHKKASRKICAPSPELLKYQRSKLKELEEAFFKKEKEANIENIMHGFIKDRNCVTAATQHIGYDLTIMMDISAFFDNVTKDHTSIEDDNLYSVEGYCAQGFATSPILANIGVISTVAWVKEYLDTVFKDRHAFTMYADDIQISINSDNFIEETDEIIETVKMAFEFAGFTIHPHKTRIRHAKHGYRRILGINVGSDHIQPTRKTLRKARAAAFEAKNSKNSENRQKAGRSLGGLKTWMRLDLPRKLRVRQGES